MGDRAALVARQALVDAISELEQLAAGNRWYRQTVNITVPILRAALATPPPEREAVRVLEEAIAYIADVLAVHHVNGDVPVIVRDVLIEVLQTKLGALRAEGEGGTR